MTSVNNLLSLLLFSALISAVSVSASAPWCDETQDSRNFSANRFSGIPEELWRHVGSCLKTDEIVRAMGVNRQWSSVFRAVKAQKKLLYPFPLPVAFESLRCLLSQANKQQLGLNLEFMRMSSEQMQNLVPHLGVLRICVLERCSLDERMMERFSTAAIGLKELSLLDCRVTQNRALSFLRHLTRLVKLSVSQAEIDDNLIVQLVEAGLPLRELSLSDTNGLTSTGFQAISGFTKLESLLLAHTKIRAEDVEVLAEKLRLRKLDLTGCSKVSKSALMALGHMTSLRGSTLPGHQWMIAYSKHGVRLF